jgi:hypothetical protein
MTNVPNDECRTQVRRVGVVPAAVVVWVVGRTALAIGQYSAFQPAAPTPVYQLPRSYADYFNEQVHSYQRPPVSGQQYIIDRYFYHRPTLSPYLNLTRRSSPDTLNNYYRYVLPEVDRRQHEAAASGTAPLTARPSVTPSGRTMVSPHQTAAAPPVSSGHFPVQNPYFNQFYNFGSGTHATSPPKPLPLPKLFP